MGYISAPGDVFVLLKMCFLNFIGAAVFSVIGYFYLIGRNKGIFASKFIPQLKTAEEIEKDKK